MLNVVNTIPSADILSIGTILSDQKCCEIISLLNKKPEYVRKISETLHDRESRISERLNRLRKIGLVDYRWRRISGRNVKEYFLTAKKIEISLDSQEPSISLKGIREKTFQFPRVFDFSFPAPKFLVGRKEELKILKEHGAVIVSGMHGIGKTALVAEFVRKNNLPVFWHKMRETDSIDYMFMKFSSFLEKYGIKSVSKIISSHADLRLVSDLIIYELRKTNAILVFDDFQLCKDTRLRSFIKDISESVPRIKIIIISSEDEQISRNFKSIKLKGLSPRESLKLLRLKGKIHDDYTISLMGGYPLALSTFKGIGDYERMRDTIIKVLSKEINENLKDREKFIIKIASAFREGFTLEDMKAVTDMDAEKELGMLYERGLIHKNGDTFGVDDLVKSALRLLDPDISVAHSKIANFYLSDDRITSKLEAIYHLGFSDDSNILIRTIKEYSPKIIDSGLSDKLLAVLKFIKSTSYDERVKGWAILWISKLEQMHGRYHKSIDLFDESAVIGEAYDKELLARSLLGKGQSLYLAGRPREALELMRNALSICSKYLKIEELKAHVLLSMDGPLSDLGFMDESLASLSASMRIYSRLKDKRNYFTCIAYKGWRYLLKGELRKSLRQITAAYRGLFDLNLLISAASCQLQRAIVLWKMGRPASAYRLASKAIEMFEDQSTAISELAETYSYRALFSAYSGNIKKAELDLEKCKKITSGHHYSDIENVVILAKGMILKKKGRIERALKTWQSVRKQFSSDPLIISEIEMNKGLAMIEKGDLDNGESLLHRLDDKCSNYGLKICSMDVSRILNKKNSNHSSIKLPIGVFNHLK